MRIEIKRNCVIGYVDYNQSGYETNVISISVVGDDGIKVQSATYLPTRHDQAKLVLACFNKAFEAAESIYMDQL